MKVLYILALLPILALAKPSLKLQLLARLLQTLDRRDNGYQERQFDDLTSSTPEDLTTEQEPDLTTIASPSTQTGIYTTEDADTTPLSDDTTPMSDDTTPMSDDTTPLSDDTTPMSDDTTPLSVDTTQLSDDTTPQSVDTSSEISYTTPDNVQTTSSPTSDEDGETELPPIDEDDLPLTPEEYIRHVTEGMCVMLAYVKGKEGTSKGSDMDNMVKNRAHGGRKDNRFPWKQAESILQRLCHLIDSYNEEPMKLAEAFVKQMAEHKGRDKRNDVYRNN